MPHTLEVFSVLSHEFVPLGLVGGEGWPSGAAPRAREREGAKRAGGRERRGRGRGRRRAMVLHKGQGTRLVWICLDVTECINIFFSCISGFPLGPREKSGQEDRGQAGAQAGAAHVCRLPRASCNTRMASRLDECAEFVQLQAFTQST